MRHARVLNDAGYGVLATDARGHGGSGGQGMDLGWYGELDIRAAVDALAARRDVDADRIGVVGLSMGGEEAIGAAGADSRIRAVVAEGATGRTAADKAWLAEEYGVLGRVQGVLDAATYGLVDLLTPADPPPTLEQSIRDSSPTAMLLVAAGDRPDEESVAVRLASLDPTRVQVWVVSGAGHVAALRTDPADWREHVVGFLDVALAGRTAAVKGRSVQSLWRDPSGITSRRRTARNRSGAGSMRSSGRLALSRIPPQDLRPVPVACPVIDWAGRTDDLPRSIVVDGGELGGGREVTHTVARTNVGDQGRVHPRSGMIRQLAFWSLVALTGFNALSAIAGGIAVLVTNGLGMPTSFLASGPFTSFVWPGVLLAVVVGGSQVLAGGLLIARREASLLWAAVAGFVMLVWIFVETIMIGGGSFLQVLYFATGGAEIILVLALLGIVAWLPRQPLRGARATGL